MTKYYAICDKDDHPIFQSTLMKDVAEFAGVTSSTICHALKRKEAGLLQHSRYAIIEDIDEEDE